MRVGISDLRDWGYRKINKYFLSDTNFLADILLLSATTMDKKITAYGFPIEWKKEHQEDYKGINMLMYHVEPMIDNIEPDDICKRKFRNTYDSILEYCCANLGISDGSIQSIYRLGLRLSTIENYCHIKKFFSSILIWGILTKGESSLDSMNFTIESLTDKLVELDNEEFVEFLINL